MKPDNWNQLSEEEKMEIGEKLLQSTRGYYLLWQALTKAVDAMKEEKYPEFSNIEDMEILIETVFKHWNPLRALQQEEE